MPSQAPQPNTPVGSGAETPGNISESPEITMMTTTDELKAKESGVISASDNIVNPGMPQPTPMKKQPISNSHTGSPAFSLEATLLDRKCCLAAMAVKDTIV